MREIKRYKTIAKAVTALEGGVIAVKEVVVEPCDKGYLVMHPDHLAAMQQAKIDAVRLLDAALCPCCDKSGAYYDNYGDVHQCQWCYEVEQLKEQVK